MSHTQGTTAEPASVPATVPVPEPETGEPAHRPTHLATRGPADRRVRPTRLLAVVLLGTVALAGYLFASANAWQGRADDYLDASLDLGAELASTRGELAGAQSELEGVRGQLATAQQRIIELANEKAQLGDESEIQQQLVDYQERVSEAAGQVAQALNQCVQGQNQLIGYMENADQYDPGELEEYATSVQTLCQQATEANIALQRELAR